MKLFDGSSQLTLVRWYRCADGAKLLPFPTVFNSLVWTNPEDQGDGLGEVSTEDRQHQNGRNRGYTGKCYQGEPAWYLEGAPSFADVEPEGETCCVHFLSCAGGISGGNAVPTADLSADGGCACNLGEYVS